jgi:hypothetical protein
VREQLAFGGLLSRDSCQSHGCFCAAESAQFVEEIRGDIDAREKKETLASKPPREVVGPGDIMGPSAATTWGDVTTGNVDDVPPGFDGSQWGHDSDWADEQPSRNN